MRLIDADRLLKVLSKYEDDSGNFKSEYEYGLMQMLETIGYEVDDAPTVDAVPVRRGRWETDGMMMDDGEYLMTRCTACGEAYEYGFNMPFCPNCGARMDGKGNGNETD